MFKYLTSITAHFAWALNLLLRHTVLHDKQVPNLEEQDSSSACYHQSAAGEAVECSVCLCKIDEGDEIRKLGCSHLFHRVCLDKWVDCGHFSCPLCRSSLSPRRTITELGVEILTFKFWWVKSSPEDYGSWWLR